MATLSSEPILAAVHQRVLSKLPDGPNRANFVGAVRAVSYRYRAVSEYGDDYLTTLPQLDTEDNRYSQEKALLGFFVSGLAALESFYFGAYFVGEYLQPAAFPLATSPRRITPATTVKAYQNAYSSAQPPEPFLTALQNVASDAQFAEWSDQRNFLAHRVSPSRDVQLETVVSFRRNQPSRSSRTDVWKAATLLPLDQHVTNSRLTWLTDV